MAERKSAAAMTDAELKAEYDACHWWDAQETAPPGLYDRMKEVEAEIDRRPSLNGDAS